MEGKVHQNPKQTQRELEQESKCLLESAIERNLEMTYEERIEAHENARELLNDLKEAGEKLRAESQGSA